MLGLTISAGVATAALKRYQVALWTKNLFVVLEAWSDPAKRIIHAKAADPAKKAKGTVASIYAIANVDIIPAEQFPPCKRKVKETGPCGNTRAELLILASKTLKGAARFDALTQSTRSNHMTVVEQWNSEVERVAHQDMSGCTI